MPMVWLRAHGEALEELQAEEAFRAAEVYSVGCGKLKKSQHDKIIRRWNAAMGRDTVMRVRSQKDLARLASFGIKVHNEPR